jgi:hypothetical protein
VGGLRATSLPLSALAISSCFCDKFTNREAHVRGHQKIAGFILPGLVLFSAAVAQEQEPQPVIGQAMKSGASLPLRSIKRRSAARQQRLWEFPVRPLNRRMRGKQPGGVFDPVVQSFALASMPGPTLSFDGLRNADNANTFLGAAIPPDPNGDIGPNHYVQTVNLVLRVFNKTTGSPLANAVALSDLFTGFGGLCENGVVSDPIVLYDPLADRWFISYLALDLNVFGAPVPPFHQCVACSQTADPAGAYNLYDFQMPNSWLNDYPKFGVWPDAYYMTDNQFDSSTDPEVSHGAGVFALDRAKILAGDPTAGFIYFDLEQLDPEIDGLLPADLDGPPPPIGTPNYMTCLVSTNFGDPQGDGLRVFEFHTDFAHPASSMFTERPESPVSVASFDPQLFCNPTEENCIPQPGPANTTPKLEVLSDRLMHRLQYRNYSNNETLVMNHTVDVGGNHAGIRYYQLKRNLPGGSFFVNEQASFAPDANHRWMGSAAMDCAGNLAVGYSVSSTNTFPSIRYAGRLASDLPGGLFQGEGTLQAGGGSQTDASSRWGDYSMLAVDPTDDCTFWYTTEYYPSTSDTDWHTRIGNFKFSGCPPAPKGTLQGVVTDAQTGLPLSNAMVRTANGFLRITSGSGAYAMSVPPATYDVTASALNHSQVTVFGITVSNGGTITQNFALPQAPVMTLVSSSSSDAAGNNNGAIDPNECISFNVVLKNTGLITASNIVTTLSTTTAGVSVSQPVSAYPNAAVGVSRTNSTPFQISTSPALLCGGPISLDLTVTHNGGTEAIPIQLITGSDGATARFDATDTPVTIDFLTGGSSDITITGGVSRIAKLTVSLYMTSDDNSQLDIYLVGPDNTTVALATSTGGAFGQDYGTACSPIAIRTTFDDLAGTSIYAGTNPFTGSYKPEEKLSAFNGKSGSAVNGTWTLAVGNFLADAALECWSLQISQPSCANGTGGCATLSLPQSYQDWQIQYFGCTNCPQAQPDADPLGKGINNTNQFLAGLNPTNPASLFRITSIVSTGSNILATWSCGGGRTNVLQAAPNLGGSYSNISANIILSGVGDMTTNYLDVGAVNTTARYYRVRLVP